MEMSEFLDTDKKFCSIVFDVLRQKGVKDVVCSPGSRNAPMLIAAAAREDLRKHVVVDERCAAFMALGIAMVSRNPVALVCTSGTALLNYAPAVAEAFYQGVPLIVLSADRPKQWIDQDDSQTLRQFEALSNFVKKSYELPAWGDDDPELQWYANRIANDAMIEAASRRKGPVHINICLGDPLGKKCPGSGRPERVVEMYVSDGMLNREVERSLALELIDKRVMLVAGFMPPGNQMQRSVADFSSLPNVAVMAETLSNLHLPDMSHSVDSVLTAYPEEDLDRLSPDIVISIGGSLVSRKLKEYLRRNKDRCSHWAVGWSHTTSDCFMSLNKRIEVEPSRFLRHMSGCVKSAIRKGKGSVCPDYSGEWKEARERALEVKERFVAEAPWSELRAFCIILRAIPRSANLFLSNGTAVRYAQILDYVLPHGSYCNRGVSGIDGSCSTAIGGAVAYKGTTVLITGDLSMAYDLGSLALPEVPSGMKVIVIDNSGGGIFRFIPTTSALEEREDYFCVPPVLPLRNLAEGYGWGYVEAHDEKGVREGMATLLSFEGKCIMRVVCDGMESAAILKSYMKERVGGNGLEEKYK